MKQFLQFSRTLSERDLKPLALDPDPSYFKASNLQDIQTKIDYFTILLTELEIIPSSFVIQSWLKIETVEFKLAVTHLCSLWRNMLINYLISFVTTSRFAMTHWSLLRSNALTAVSYGLHIANDALYCRFTSEMRFIIPNLPILIKIANNCELFSLTSWSSNLVTSSVYIWSRKSVNQLGLHTVVLVKKIHLLCSACVNTVCIECASNSAIVLSFSIICLHSSVQASTYRFTYSLSLIGAPEIDIPSVFMCTFVSANTHSEALYFD
ncbi:hypothetical protein GJ496_000721 [Pomphorhynchus laevis]|nr:hypothetical protein GJ496_000721 [Pomphorhynchus laevis]